MNAARVLVVDDEPDMAQLLEEWLQEDGYSAYTALDGRTALKLLYEHRPSLAIVDLRMPGMDGFELINRIRDMSDVHILVLTGIGGEENMIRSLDGGADQYMFKPVSRRPFLARVAALIRRAAPPKEIYFEYSDDTVALSARTREVTCRGQNISVRPTEFRLLSFLCQHRDRVVRHQELLDGVWEGEAGSLDSLKWYIHSLRQKIEEDPRNPRTIVTYPGVGYRYFPEGCPEQPVASL